jgi:glycosyltransferase involved in cell wall biosynthesis
MTKKAVLWVGDAACPSGFARATHGILDTVRHQYEPYVLGINYRGDPHDWPYKIWAAAPFGDSIGVKRLIWMCDLVMQETGAAPDVIVLLNDGWHIPFYMQQLRLRKSSGEYAWPDYAAVPVVAMVAVDGKNFNAEWLDGVDHTVFWTQFALDEAREAGFAESASVIPLGVDLEQYRPVDKHIARRTMGLGQIEDAFIVGNVNRNQSRKRWDLTVKYFAEWVYKSMPRTLRTGENMEIKDAWLFLHAAPTGDSSIDVRQLARYYGVDTRLGINEPAVHYGSTERQMQLTYNCFDVAISTTQGEGMGLTALEAMACRVPLVAPDWSALGDWAKGAAWLVPCSTTSLTFHGPNVIGGVPDQAQFIMTLDRLYHDAATRERNAQAAIERAQEERFRWSNIGQQFVEVLDKVTAPIANDPAEPSLEQVSGERPAFAMKET